MNSLYESEFEQQLIETLTTGQINLNPPAGEFDFNHPYKTRLWEYKPKIKTTAQLEDNFKKILERNNKASLDRPLSQTEFRQVMDRITSLKTPYEAGKFLYGQNGVSEIDIKMDDGKTVYLKVFDQSQVGGGETVYQVVNQIERPAVIAGNPDRRFDVTLLINGLPLIQIELKRDAIIVDEALNQMKKYVNERQFSGIFSTLQILVGMTPINTQYMAATTPEKFNLDFAFNWKKEDNRNVRDWKYFADHVLSIPAAHLLSTNYMILDGTKNEESIKVMRPYQVAATRKALDAVERTDFDKKCNKDGYIWHTTGSGKTITSYKTAALASKSSNVDKVIFLVDRKALTRQTLESYEAYDPETVHSNTASYTHILNTSNTYDLYKKMKGNNDKIIITSTQKMRKLVANSNYKLPDKKYLFVVDEAHRSTGSESFKAIQEAVPKSAWIGYSGTPIFDEKKKGSRTIDVFGNLLHAYTIREAIEDKNVLGFKVEFNQTFQDETQKEQMKAYYKALNPNWTEEELKKKIDSLTVDDMDDTVRGNFYDNNQKHVEAVARDIVTNWENRSNNWKYNALLTTHVGGGKASVPMALMYYKEFKKLNEIRKQVNLKPLKVAISVTGDDSNSSTVVQTRKDIKEAIDDYNQTFGTHWDMTTIDDYNIDLEDRLRKNSDDGKYLDLVIVVDRLLTGFDAPQLNTLYVDRILTGANLIQAYSRTNRIHNNDDKPFGNIVNYRWPKYAEKKMNEALAIYSNAENANLSPEEQKTKNISNNITQPEFDVQVDQAKALISQIRNLTGDLERVPTEEKKQDKLLHLMRQYNSQLTKLKQYPLKMNDDGTKKGFNYKNPEAFLDTLGITELESKTIQVTLANQLRNKISKRTNIPPYQIDLRVELLRAVDVDYDFLTKLFENLLNQVHDDKMDEAVKTKEQIDKFSFTMEDRNYARTVTEAAEAIVAKEYPTPTEKIHTKYPYQLLSTKALMENIQSAQLAYVDNQMVEFIKKWGLSDQVGSMMLQILIKNHEYGKKDLDKAGQLTQIALVGSRQYTKKAMDPKIRTLSKLSYRRELKEAIYNLADDRIKE